LGDWKFVPLVLAFHAAYACREVGRCCTSGWPIPVEAPQLDAARSAIASGRLVPTTTADPFVASSEPGGPIWLAAADSVCAFHRPDGAQRCGLQRALGHAALPLACRQFPRVTLEDPRGPSITLSHYCPTAASCLEEGAIAIVDDGPGFPAGGEYVGLDARHALPPRLRPDMLMDWDSWWEWERLSVAAIATAPSPAQAVARLHAAVEHARTWTPDEGPLTARVRDAFARPVATPPAERAAVRVGEVLATVPGHEHPPTPVPSAGGPLSPDATRRFLAAHAFANWTAHLGPGLRTWRRSIETAHAFVIGGWTAGDADLWLRHLTDPTALAEVWSRAEAGR
jgi:hypothetical protein